MNSTFKAILAALLASAALGLQAAPLLATELSVSAISDAGGMREMTSDRSLGTGPLLTSSFAERGANLSLASGFADNGLLVAQSDVQSIDAVSSARGGADFTSEFSLTGPAMLDLWISLMDEDFVDLAQSAGASLFVQLIFEGSLYFGLVLTGADAPFAQQFQLPGAGSGVLMLQLISESSALAGSASNFAQAEFRAEIQQQVDEPGTLALLLGAGLIGWAGHSRRSRRTPAPA